MKERKNERINDTHSGFLILDQYFFSIQFLFTSYKREDLRKDFFWFFGQILEPTDYINLKWSMVDLLFFNIVIISNFGFAHISASVYQIFEILVPTPPNIPLHIQVLSYKLFLKFSGLNFFGPKFLDPTFLDSKLF